MSTSAPMPAARKQRPKWQKIAIIAVSGLVIVLVLGALLGPKKTDPAPATPAGETSSVATTEAVVTTVTVAVTSEPLASYAADLASRPEPTDAQVRQIGLALVDIQPEMAEITATRIESWSDSMCGDIWTWVEGQSGNLTLAQRAVHRFGGGDRPPLTEGQGQQIVEVITTAYCHQ